MMRILDHTQSITVDVTSLPNAMVGDITAERVEIIYYRSGGRWKVTSPVKVCGKNGAGDIDLTWVAADWPDWLRDVALWCLPQDKAF